MSRLRDVTVVALGVALALAPMHAAAEAQSAAATNDAAPKQRVALAGLRLPDLDGNSVDMQTYLGKGPVVIDFWATWCKPCITSLPELNRLYADLAPRGLQIVGINEDGQRNAAKVKPFAKTQGIRYPVLLDLDREAQSRLKALVLPTTLLLDSEGNVVHTSLGPADFKELRAKIETLLGDAPTK